MRNPFYNKIPKQKIIQRKRSEPDVFEWDELFYSKRADRNIKSNKARSKRKETRNAKEARIYGE